MWADSSAASCSGRRCGRGRGSRPSVGAGLPMGVDSLHAQDKRGFAAVEPPCPYFGSCGGCSVQDLAYPDQLALKRQRLAALLAEFDPALELEIVGAEEPWRYRNKAELTFGQPRRPGPHDPAQPSSDLTLGYHAARSFSTVVDLDDCLLLPEAMSRVLRTARRLARATDRPAYHPRRHDGFFRYLILRSSRLTGSLLACLVTAPGERAVIDAMAEALMAAHPELAGVYWGVSAKLADAALPDELLLVR